MSKIQTNSTAFKFDYNKKVFTFFKNYLLKTKKNLLSGLPDRGSFDRNSLDQNCVFSVDRKFHNQLTEFFETFQSRKIQSTAKKEPTDFDS